MKEVFFTSDTHFNHSGILNICNRPFRTVEEMNEVIIANWNKTVSDDDTVYHLGDFCLGDVDSWARVRARLNGHIHLIAGNHDLKNIRQGIDGLFDSVEMQCQLVIEKHTIILNHYPFLCYSGAYKDEVWQLFGHVHTRKNNTGVDAHRLKHLLPNQYDVGVDNNNFSPVSYEQIKTIITKQQKKRW